MFRGKLNLLLHLVALPNQYNFLYVRYMAYIMDTNEEERVKGITVEVGRAHFETKTTRFTILDAPIHPSLSFQAFETPLRSVPCGAPVL
ncbi:unnamed protein product [Ilex paraguariensis]|uniref:Tr-type G domain-containing protein n=1 Tax=Ilex paraguariensis TaxID=185542 RepID=A0ABC8QZ50_9AQUA